MILPNKTINLYNSILGFGAILLKNMSKTETVSSLWKKILSKHDKLAFTKFSLVLDTLYCLNLIEFSEGMIVKKGKNDT